MSCQPARLPSLPNYSKSMHSTRASESFSGLSNATCISEMSPIKLRPTSTDMSIMTLRAHAEVLEFPPHATTKYLNEGAANIVYSIKVPHAHSPNAECRCGKEESQTCADEPWHGKLLRFRKDLPTTSPTLVAHHHFLNNVAPLFPPEDLIDIKVAHVKPSGIVAKLNNELRLAEEASARCVSPTGYPMKKRDSNRHGIYLAEDDHALLITDMSPSATTDLFQFKPKWLFPSFSAPPGSKRCRTCALHARRNHLRSLNGQPPKRGFCPFDLISPSPEDVMRAAAKILHVKPKGENSNREHLAQIWRFKEWARSTKLLRRIQSLQRQHDPSGIVNLIARKNVDLANHEVDDLESKMQIAMTLRDVTLFLLMPKDETKPCVARLGDLDLKSKGKLMDWERIEKELIQEGWYEGTEEKHGMTKQVPDCWCFPEEWTPIEKRCELAPRVPKA